jgi:hypothetical protein
VPCGSRMAPRASSVPRMGPVWRSMGAGCAAWEQDAPRRRGPVCAVREG